MGVVLAGGIVASAYPKDPYPELLDLARKVEPMFLFCGEDKLDWATKLELDLGHSVFGIAMGFEANEQYLQFQHLEHLLNYNHAQSKSFNKIPVACLDTRTQPALILMSSGTTGKPKAVPATHWSCMMDMLSFGANVTQSVKHIIVSAAALDYVSGRLIQFGAIESGYELVLLDTFEPRKYLEAVERFRATSICVGVSSFYSLITFAAIHDYDLSSVSSILPMGAKVPLTTEFRDFLAKHPHIRRLKVGYGTSEFCVAATALYSAEDYMKISNVCGRLLPGCQVKVVDPESGQLLGRGKLGLVHLKSQSLFPGYYDVRRLHLSGQDTLNASPYIADREVFDEDGFYITGDLGYFSDREELCIIGRQKEVMSCRGAKKVMPRELEDVISSHKYVAEVCVLGITKKDEPLVACPRAYVVPKPECYDDSFEVPARHSDKKLKHCGTPKLCRLNKHVREFLAEDLMNHVNGSVGWEKQLTGGIVILDEIPVLRDTGKMDKRYLRSLSETDVSIYGDQS